MKQYFVKIRKEKKEKGKLIINRGEERRKTFYKVVWQ